MGGGGGGVGGWWIGTSPNGVPQAEPPKSLPLFISCSETPISSLNPKKQKPKTISLKASGQGWYIKGLEPSGDHWHHDAPEEARLALSGFY